MNLIWLLKLKAIRALNENPARPSWTPLDPTRSIFKFAHLVIKQAILLCNKLAKSGYPGTLLEQMYFWAKKCKINILEQ